MLMKTQSIKHEFVFPNTLYVSILDFITGLNKILDDLKISYFAPIYMGFPWWLR